MQRKVKWASYVFGGAMLAALAAYPLANRSALAEEHRHPHIYHALDALKEARQELHDADSDFHGRKQEAMDSIDHAIHELDEIKDW
jgi:hypothetical protein